MDSQRICSALERIADALEASNVADKITSERSDQLEREASAQMERIREQMERAVNTRIEQALRQLSCAAVNH